jgi:hypothetical protein
VLAHSNWLPDLCYPPNNFDLQISDWPNLYGDKVFEQGYMFFLLGNNDRSWAGYQVEVQVKAKS